MGGKILTVILLAGLSLLSGRVSTQPPAGCTMDKFNSCFAGFYEHSFLIPFITLTRNQTAEQEALEQRVYNNPEQYLLLCEAWKDSIDCLKPLEETCGVDDGTSFNDVFPQLTNDIEPVQKQNHDWLMACNSEALCGNKVNTCLMDHGVGEDPDLTSSAVCGKVRRLYDCWDSESECRVYPNFTKPLMDVKRGLIHCESTLFCQGVSACYATFFSTPPKETGLDNATCLAYRDYIQCTKTAIASCSDVDALGGGIQNIPVTPFVTDVCTAMGQDDISAIYECHNFTECVDKEMSKDDFLYPEFFCRTAQAVMACAMMAVKEKCVVDVDSAAKEAFVSEMKEMMLQAQSVGCGMAQLSATECTGAMQCGASAFPHLADDGEDNDEDEDEINGTDFYEGCMEIKNFLSCADSQVEECGADDPQTMPTGGKPVPEMSDISPIVMDMCTTVNNTDLAICPEFFRCLDLMTPPIENEFLAMNSHAWCRYLVHTVQCAHGQTRTCKKTASQKAKIVALYDDIINAGCKSVYGYMVQGNLPDTTPTSGTLPQTAVGWMGMLLPLLFCWLM